MDFVNSPNQNINREIRFSSYTNLIARFSVDGTSCLVMLFRLMVKRKREKQALNYIKRQLLPPYYQRQNSKGFGRTV